MPNEDNTVRLDKWLWAARFFKTRALAHTAVEGGKVHYNKARAKPSKLVQVGATIKVRQGFAEKTVIVTALSDKRGNAQQAALLYEETMESIKERDEEAAIRKLSAPLRTHGRPDKKTRQQIHRFKRGS